MFFYCPDVDYNNDVMLVGVLNPDRFHVATDLSFSVMPAGGLVTQDLFPFMRQKDIHEVTVVRDGFGWGRVYCSEDVVQAAYEDHVRFIFFFFCYLF